MQSRPVIIFGNLINDQMKASKILRTPYPFIVTGIFLLAMAYAVTLSFSGIVDMVQSFAWFFTYERGYRHRALLATIFQFLHGPTTAEKIHEFVPLYEKGVLLIVVFLFWAMFIPRIWLSNFARRDKWALMAAAAVPMLAPVWKLFGLHAGFMDEWVLLFVLAAFLCFLGKRPLGYVCFMVPPFFIHPLTLFYALLMAALISHALIRNQHYSRRWRIWTLAALLPLCISGLLGTLHLAENTTYFLEMNKQELLKMMPMNILEYLRGTFSAPIETDMPVVLARWKLWPYSIPTGLIMYAVPILAYAAVFSYQIGKAAAHRTASFLSIDHPLLRKLVPWENYLITILACFHLLPIYFMGDWGRFIYLIWISAGIASAYLIWFHTQELPRETAGHEGIAKKNGAGLKGHFLTGLTALWAYVYSGAPLVLGNATDPSVFRQMQQVHLHFPWNSNPLGEAYAQKAIEFLAWGITHDVYADAETVYRWNKALDRKNPLNFKDGRLLVPAGFQQPIWSTQIRVLGNRSMTFAVNHERGGAVALMLNNQAIQPSIRIANKTVWAIMTPDHPTFLLHFAFFSQAESGFRVSSLEINYI